MILERIMEYLNYKGITRYRFYKDTGLSNGFLDKKGSIGVDKCEIIYNYYPDINLEWLITGRGAMVIDTSLTDTGAKDLLIQTQNELIQSLKKQIEYLSSNNIK